MIFFLLAILPLCALAMPIDQSSNIGHQAMIITAISSEATLTYDGPVWWVSSWTGNDLTGEGTFDLPFQTIQKAIDMAHSGDTVIAMSGQYYYDGNRDLDFGGKNLYLHSVAGPDSTLIYCHGTETDRHRAFYFHSGEDSSSVIEGFTIGKGSQYMGAGVLIENSSPTFINCFFREHHTYPVSDIAYGGAICVINSTSRFIDCTIKYNWSPFGAGVYISGGAPVFENCNIARNTAEPVAFTASGGGIYCDNSAAIFDFCRITWNTAVDAGGMVIAEGSPIFNNCTVAANESTDNSSAVKIISSDFDISPIFTNTLIAFNQGIAVECSEGAAAIMPSFSNCDIYGNGLGDWSGCIAGMETENYNTAVDPLFCSLNNAIYTLEFRSPCLAGNNPAGVQIGALGYGCGDRKTEIVPGFMYAYYAFSVDSIYADIYLWDIELGTSVHDVDTTNVLINDDLVPFDFQYIDDNGIEKLKMSVGLRPFVMHYWPLRDTTAQTYSLKWVSLGTKHYKETYGWVRLRGHITGDVNGDNQVDMLDITYLISYIYRDGRAPLPVPETGDIDGSGNINILDITYLIRYILADGLPPVKPFIE